MALDAETTPDPRPRKVPLWIDLILAALRGEASITDDDLILILGAQPDAASAKCLCVGLNAHLLISDEQTALAFYAFPLREA
jgi:hypothetical protein